MVEMPEFSDKILKCVDCGQSFVFARGEQAHFYSKGLHEPKRCKPCREKRKAQRASQGPPPLAKG